MTASRPPLFSAATFINEKPVSDEDSSCGVRFDFQTCEIVLAGYQKLIIYPFNSLMINVNRLQAGAEKFIFDGPRLGVYCDVKDVREGPYINHFIKHLEIYVSYPSKGEANIKIFGQADLSESGFDKYWYKGPTSGQWAFSSSFVYRHPNP